jgi:1,4-dihydroxy-2-naphthoyl-CoA hydrolase
MQAPEPVPYERTFDALYGLEIIEATGESASARVRIDDRHRQLLGLVHGGVYAAIAESLTSIATWVGVGDEDSVTMGMSNHTTFLRPATGGTISARATPRHKGRTTWIWDIEFVDDEERVVAISRMTIAVRPRADR